VFFGEEVDGVEGLGLELAHGGNRGVVGGEVRACEGAPGELETWSVGGEVVEEGTGVVLALPESGGGILLELEWRYEIGVYLKRGAGGEGTGRRTRQRSNRPWPAPQ
jgi:hypothetical protein